MSVSRLVLLCAALGALLRPEPQSPLAATAPLHVVRRYAAPEAKQGVAVDAEFFYAIDDAAIGKYEKRSGRRVAEWKAGAADRIEHLDGGVAIGTRLYCAHSNYPRTPMASSVEIFDTARMAHLESVRLPHLGSATWLDRADGTWWIAFAHYATTGGEPGKTPADTVLAQFDDRWQERRRWSFPAAVVQRWDGMSSSGGIWLGRHLYTTGHHAREIYVMTVPSSGSELALAAIIPFESEGQGIAIDRVARHLYSIQRRTREVLVSQLPPIP